MDNHNLELSRRVKQAARNEEELWCQAAMRPPWIVSDPLSPLALLASNVVGEEEGQTPSPEAKDSEIQSPELQGSEGWGYHHPKPAEPDMEARVVPEAESAADAPRTAEEGAAAQNPEDIVSSPQILPPILRVVRVLPM
jgi:hypothetical protein